jgi:hypothetical protein
MVRRMMLLMAVVGIALVAGGLSGCSTTLGKKVEADLFAPVQQATLADAQAALVIAQANNDAEGVQCYTDIVNYLQNKLPTLPVVSGVLSVLEAARTFKGVSVPEDIHRDCAVIVLDSQQTALRLGLIVR